MAFDSEYLWLEGQVVPHKDAKIHFLTSSIHYGTSVFDGIRCYSTTSGPAVFRLKDHIKRILKSAGIIGLIDHRKIGSCTMGNVDNDLQKAYDDVIHGKNENYIKWNDFVLEKETEKLVAAS